MVVRVGFPWGISSPRGRPPPTCRCLLWCWLSAPTPMTSNSGVGPPWPSGPLPGLQLHYLILTDGSKGSWDPDADPIRLVAERAVECQAAAAVVDGRPDGATPKEDRVLFLQQVDGELDNGLDQRRAVARVIRQVRPTAVLGHDPWRRYRLHPDHRAAGFLTIDALVAARDPHFFTELGLDPHRPEALLLFEADMPNHLEDAGGFADAKIEALLRHRSQLESTMGIGSPGASAEPSASERSEFASKVRRQLAAHGSLACLASAEAFRLLTDL